MPTTCISPDIVGAFPLFSELNEKENAELRKIASIKHYAKGQTIFLQGDQVTLFRAVCEGSVQLFHETPDGHELTSYIIHKGEILLDASLMIEERLHSINARTVTEATLLQIPIDGMRRFIKSCDHIAIKILILLARRLEDTQVENEHQATMNAAQIVACFLQHVCANHAFDPSEFKLPYTKSLIASRLSMELETLSRAMTKLNEYGIAVRGKQVRFQNIEAAQNYSCGACTMAEECHARKTMYKLSKNVSELRNKKCIAVYIIANLTLAAEKMSEIFTSTHTINLSLHLTV